MEAHLMQTSALDMGAVLEQLHRARQSTDGATFTTINLVAYVDDAELHARILERANLLAEKYPARIVVLNAFSEDEPKVTTQARQAGAGSTIVAEVIELGCADQSPQAICSAVNTLRVTDVPNLLYWTSISVANEILFEDLSKMMDTIIVDSSGNDAKADALRELSDFFASDAERDAAMQNVVIRDLAFMRLAPWQDMIAQFFDDPQFLAELERISRMEIKAGSEAEAYYLVAWIGSRLGWKPCGRFSLCDRQDREIRVDVQREGQARRVFRVALSTGAVTYTAELTDQPDTVCLSVSTRRETRCAPL
ncbi:MAG: glucose-6-phosphate dehydrogenase assembly protein OpcA, partial [Candidatus Eremiobacteraeota bacterium]|nr:glucose-6-phosphate dehydrogenase assembly protein OpcA [Candidatus Eremiobacteraeota bacterium]